MKHVARFPFALGSILIGGLLAYAALFTELDIVTSGIATLEKLQDGKLDDLIVAVVLAIVGIAVDLARSQRRLDIEAQRLETLKATMRTVQDLVGNALNNLLLFRLEAEDHVSAEALQQFDDILRDTSQRLAQLGNLDTIVEKPMASGTGIEYERPITLRRA